MRSSRQSDKSEQWVIRWAVKDEVLGSILGRNKQKVFFHLQLYLLHRLCIPTCFNNNQLSIRSRKSFNKAKTDDTVKNSMFRRTDVYNKRIVT